MVREMGKDRHVGDKVALAQSPRGCGGHRRLKGFLSY